MRSRLGRRGRWSLAIAVAGSALAAGTAHAAPPQPTISGTAQPGEVLTASPASDAYTYRWLRCNDEGYNCPEIEGATGQTYHLGNSDFDRTIRVRITDAEGAPAESAATDVVGRPVMEARPKIYGGVYDLEAWHGDFSPNGPGYTFDYSYEWMRCNLQGWHCTAVSPSSIYSDYTIVEADFASRMRVRVTARNRAGRTTVLSLPSAPIGKPMTWTPPRITGTPTPGRTLTIAKGDWYPADTIDTYSYGWLRCNSAGYGCARFASGTTYAPTAGDAGLRLRAVVTATNEAGTTSVTSAPTARVGAPVGSTRPVVTGVARAGETLTVNTGTWSPAATSFAYRWELCGSETMDKCRSVGTGSSYTLTEADGAGGWAARAWVTASNANGNGTMATRPTARIVPAG